MAILVEKIGPFRFKQPAPFMPSALGINGAAFYIVPVFPLLDAQPKPFEFTEQSIASENHQTVRRSIGATTERDIIVALKDGLNIYYNESIKQ
ncbi:hypothetical protein DHC50_13930 [Arenibacter sp. A80]|nr:hypothetical protein [Arenibacter sp. A80]RFT55773.1 hypothetical protein D0S24_13925 [Arenibacter sp. P308M17]